MTWAVPKTAARETLALARRLGTQPSEALAAGYFEVLLRAPSPSQVGVMAAEKQKEHRGKSCSRTLLFAPNSRGRSSEQLQSAVRAVACQLEEPTRTMN